MLYLMLFYVYLCIHRPMEIWPALGDMRPELIYFIVLTACWLIAPKRLRSPGLMLAVVGMGSAFVVSLALSPWAEQAEQVVKNYTLVVVFALMIATAVRDERGLHKFVIMFLAVMTLYMLHSVWEYRMGRHTFRMGIVRLIGVDKTLGDPNSFGASIVYALPFVQYLWVAWPVAWRRWGLVVYVLLSAGCILLTGSRSSLVGLTLWGFLNLLLTRRKFQWLAGLAMLAVGGWFALPESLQTRFETIIDPSVGPANAQTSGQGRIEGFFIGLKLWGEYPIAGCGPGAWRPASGAPIEAHNLYGQVMGELGTIGVIAFGFLVVMLLCNVRKLTRLTHPATGSCPDRHMHALGRAMAMSTILLLFEGMFGHNLFRYNWSWYCAFTAVALDACRARWTVPDDATETEAEAEEWDYSMSPAAV
jgi:O-antigen ligase